MSRNTRSLVPALTLATLAAIGLARPVLAQTGDRAFLNRVPVAVENQPVTMADEAIVSKPSSIDAARALLGRVESSAAAILVLAVESAPIDGERALLGRWPAFQSRRPGVWAVARPRLG